MKRYVILIAIVFLVGACKEKGTVISQQNVREVLRQYAAANPENEVTIETSYGTMKLRLYAETPLHRANFIKLIKEGEFDNGKFYRVMYDFMIQGGDQTKQLPYRIPAEFQKKYIHKKGALSMARMIENNPAMESSAEQFFIVHGTRYNDEDLESEMRYFGLTLTPEQKQLYKEQGGTMELDQKFTVFGEVTEGLDVIEKIAKEQLAGTEAPAREIPFTIKVSVAN